MTLHDYLKTLPPEETVYIGGSTRFFYIGTVINAPIEIQEVESIMRKRIRGQYLEGLCKLEFITTVAAARYKNTAYTAEIKRDTAETEFSRQYWEMKLDEANKKFAEIPMKEANCRFYVERLKRWLDVKTPFIDCEVVTVYPRRWIKPLGKIIIIDREVEGEFWSVDEIKEVAP